MQTVVFFVEINIENEFRIEFEEPFCQICVNGSGREHAQMHNSLSDTAALV